MYSVHKHAACTYTQSVHACKPAHSTHTQSVHACTPACTNHVQCILALCTLHASRMMPCTSAALLHKPASYSPLSLSCLVHDTPACMQAGVRSTQRLQPVTLSTPQTQHYEEVTDSTAPVIDFRQSLHDVSSSTPPRTRSRSGWTEALLRQRKHRCQFRFQHKKTP